MFRYSSNASIRVAFHIFLMSSFKLYYPNEYFRSLLDQTVKELQQQVSMMRQREAKVLEQNRELQHTILDLEQKLEEVQDRSQTAFEMVRSLCTHCMPIAFHWVGALFYLAFRVCGLMFSLGFKMLFTYKSGFYVIAVTTHIKMWDELLSFQESLQNFVFIQPCYRILVKLKKRRFYLFFVTGLNSYTCL